MLKSMLSLRGLEPRFVRCAACVLVVIITDLFRQTIKIEVTRDGDGSVIEWQVANKMATLVHHFQIHISLGRSSKYCNYMYTGLVSCT